MSLNFKLNEKIIRVKHHISKNTHKFISLEFWIRGFLPMYFSNLSSIEKTHHSQSIKVEKKFVDIITVKNIHLTLIY